MGFLVSYCVYICVYIYIYIYVCMRENYLAFEDNWAGFTGLGLQTVLLSGLSGCWLFSTVVSMAVELLTVGLNGLSGCWTLGPFCYWPQWL